MKKINKSNFLLSLFIPSLTGGGAERVVLNIGDYISRQNIHVDLLVASAKGEYKNKIPEKIRLIELGTTKPIHAVPKLIYYLRKTKPSALLSTITNANIAASIAILISRTQMRWVVREASTLGIEIKKSSQLNQLILPFIVKKLYSRASFITAPSSGVADDLSNIIKQPLNKIQVIPNPIISASMLAKATAQPDHNWFKNPGLPVIIGVGRLTAQKDFITLINAFELLRKNIKVKLIIIGEGNQRQLIEASIKNKGLDEDIALPGFIDNPYSYLSRASVFVLSSKWEGLPGALIEALACGTKVISTDCPHGPKEILKNGLYGQLVPVGDYVAMADAINKTLTGKYKAADPKEYIKTFDANINGERYLRLLMD